MHQKKIETEVLIASDIHLGSAVSRSEEFLEFLKQSSFKKLILNGDIFDDLNIKHFRTQDWNLLAYLRELPRVSGKEVIWIVGDHEGDTKNFSLLIGIPVQSEYFFDVAGKRCLAMHGDQFDRLMKDTHVMRFLGYVAGAVYHFFQRIDMEEQRVSRWIKRTSKWFLRVSQGVARGAIAYAKKQNVRYVFCGHTHWKYSVHSDPVFYWNSGCWADIPSNYITIDSSGSVEIGDY